MAVESEDASLLEKLSILEEKQLVVCVYDVRYCEVLDSVPKMEGVGRRRTQRFDLTYWQNRFHFHVIINFIGSVIINNSLTNGLATSNPEFLRSKRDPMQQSTPKVQNVVNIALNRFSNMLTGF